jgi:hypothetical protein
MDYYDLPPSKMVVDTHGPCDLCTHFDGNCGGPCCEMRRAKYWRILMGYMSSNCRAYAELGHRSGCPVAKTRHTGDGHIRPCETHFRALLPRKLPPVTSWLDAILDTLPECPGCGATLHWSKRQEVYLFGQHLSQPHSMQDPHAVAAHLRHLGKIDNAERDASVRAVADCDRAIYLAQEKRALALRDIVESDIPAEHLREVLPADTVAEVISMRAT